LATTLPQLYSTELNKVDFQNLKENKTELRVVYLDGYYASIEISSKESILLCENENSDLDKKNREIIEKLSEEFFYGKAVLYGVIKNDEFYVYDINTNENFFSSRDINYLKEKFGLKTVETILEGYFSTEDYIKVLNEKMLAGYNCEKIVLLPNVYINDKREQDEEIIYETQLIKKQEIVKIPNYNYCFGYQDYDDTPVVTKPKKEKAEVLKTSTKDERREIYSQVLKNVTAYVEKIKPELSEQELNFWRKNGAMFCYLYSIYTLPKTRELIYNFLDKMYFYKSGYITDSEELGEVMFEMFDAYHSDAIDKHNIRWLDADTFCKLFKEELTVLLDFYKKEYLGAK
jgi:hypothetical protein